MKKNQPNIKLRIIFGTKDLFTINQRGIVNKLEAISGSMPGVHRIKGGKHYVHDSDTVEICHYISGTCGRSK